MYIYLQVITKHEKTKEETKIIFDKYNIKSYLIMGYLTNLPYYKINEQFIRKLKLEKLKYSTEFDDIINMIYDKTLIKIFTEDDMRSFGIRGTTGAIGSIGTDGVHLK